MSTFKVLIKDEKVAKSVSAAVKAIKSRYKLEDDDAACLKLLAFGASRAKALIKYDDSDTKAARLKKQAAERPKKEKKAKTDKPKKAKKIKKAKKPKTEKPKTEKKDSEVVVVE